MSTQRTSWNPHFWLATVSVMLAVTVACSGDDDAESSRGSSNAPTVERGANHASRAEGEANGSTTSTTSATIGAAAGPATASEDAGDCAEVQSWGIDPEDAAPMNPADLYLVRAGQHDCFDRVVFDVNGIIDGPEGVGYSVAYVPAEVSADASGEAVPTAGAAALQVIVRAPALGYGTSGHQPWRSPARVGDDYFTSEQLRGWGSFREITFAGSFEGQSTIAVGVDSRLPFRVGSYDQGGHSHVYVDVAHPR